MILEQLEKSPETIILTKFKKEQVENGNFQLAFIFESEVA